MATQLTKDGITWHFDADYNTGQFINGDYWVQTINGTVGVSGISPSPTSTYNGSMVNPDPKVYGQGFYSIHGTPPYMASLNVAASLPFNLSDGDSLVSPDCFTSYHRAQLKKAAVLTVVDTPPAANTFRPGYSASSTRKALNKYSLTSLDFTKLKNLSTDGIAGIPSWAALEARFAPLWLDYMGRDENGRFLHPADWMPDYGRDLALFISDAMLKLNTSATTAVKTPLLISIVQLGIDLFEIMMNGGSFEAAGGHDQGRLAPILFAGAILNDSEMLNYMFTSPTPEFGMTDQTFFLPSNYASNSHYIGYSDSLIGLPDWGQEERSQASEHPTYFQWNADDYRRCCTANSLIGEILALKAMDIDVKANNNAFIEYQHRYLDVQSENGSTSDAWKYKGWSEHWWQYDMWRKHAHTVGKKGWMRKVGTNPSLWNLSYPYGSYVTGDVKAGETLNLFITNNLPGYIPMLLIGNGTNEDGWDFGGAKIYMNTIVTSDPVNVDSSGHAKIPLPIPSDFNGTFNVQVVYIHPTTFTVKSTYSYEFVV